MRDHTVPRPALRRAATALLLGATCWTGPMAAWGASAQAPVYNIYELQHSDAAHDWQSLHLGEIVGCTGGVVTHKFRQRIVLQDTTFGSEWAAIEVRGYPVYPTGIEIGDQVDFDSVFVDEYRGATVLQYYNASSHIVQSGGHPMPEPVALSVQEIRYPPHPEDSERYAAMLVTLVEPVHVGAMDLGGHDDNYELIGAFGDTAWASDYANTEIDTAYYVSAGECYCRLTGVLQRYDDDGEWDYYQLLPRAIEDYVPCVSSIEAGTGQRPSGPSLALAYPNPFAYFAHVPFRLPRAAHARLEILDPSGRSVRILADRHLGAGDFVERWDGMDDLGREAGAGVYFARLVAEGATVTRKIILCR